MAILKAILLLVLCAETWVPASTTEVVFQGTSWATTYRLQIVFFFFRFLCVKIAWNAMFRTYGHKVRGHFRKLVEKAIVDLKLNGLKIKKRPWEQGPAVTCEIMWTEFPSISIDLAVGLDISNWPPPSIARPRPVGTDAKVQLAPKVKHDPSANPAFWQISTAQVEAQIFNNIDKDGGCRKKVLKLAKYFKLKSGTGWHPVTSYNLKTILLRMNDEKRQPPYWAQGMLVLRFKELIDRLLKHLRSGYLPNFFIPKENLFAGEAAEIKGAIVGVNDFLKMLRANPERLLMYG